MEQDEYANYKELEGLEERDKYAPKIPRFSAGVGVKRTFGSVVWNKEGMMFYDANNKTRKAAFKDDNIWEWMCDG